MTDYWKSNPKKYCEFCCCWYADNKISIEFHESGNRHKSNVTNRLQRIRDQDVVKSKEKLEMSAAISEIERR
ncbi:hypothetical protein GJ496_009069 [Pomphorhynchus laevis]|nr:hypothetical protein GJ496_009069 [Pomphorhynchus laevis]